MMKLICFLILAFHINLKSQNVKIAAASDMKYIMPEIVAKFKIMNPNVMIEIFYGSSGMFYQQISNGASFDVYFSADISYPQKLKEQGFIIGDVRTYAFGSLVLYSSTIDISKGIDVLKEPSIQKIAIANPQHAPYGKRAEECLKYYELYETVKTKLVYGENITQTAQFAITGNADVALIALAIAMAPELKTKGKYIILDTLSYKPLEQACVLIKSWQKNPEAAKFMNYVLSADCKPIFEKYGFIVP
jgi:molybdate transport system substrate-binding protein